MVCARQQSAATGQPGWRSHGTAVTLRNNRRAVFSVRGQRQRFITDTAHHLLEQ
jgi:hypothetical protein